MSSELIVNEAPLIGSSNRSPHIANPKMKRSPFTRWNSGIRGRVVDNPTSVPESKTGEIPKSHIFRGLVCEIVPKCNDCDTLMPTLALSPKLFSFNTDRSPLHNEPCFCRSCVHKHWRGFESWWYWSLRICGGVWIYGYSYMGVGVWKVVAYGCWEIREMGGLGYRAEGWRRFKGYESVEGCRCLDSLDFNRWVLEYGGDIQGGS